MASLKSFGTEPQRFQRTQRGNTSSERAASPSEASSVDNDEPGGVRLDLLSITGSPQEKYTPPHARQGLGASLYMESRRTTTDSPSRITGPNERDDVFTSPRKSALERRGDRSVTVANMQRLDDSLAAMGDAGLPTELRPRNSNLSTRHQINGVDAQILLPPTACVFVANLPEPKDDVALEAGLTREFINYGKCYIKIRRDGRHMPFAFIQYTSETEAHNALVGARGKSICGRACRTEMVKANRTFVIMRKYGPAITISEARAVLAVYGEIAKTEMLHSKLREPLGYPPTVLVEFTMFDPNRDLHTAFRNHDQYSVAAFDLKKNCAANRLNGDEAYLANCERDRRSIFIGDLPASTEQDDLGAMFSEAGEVLKVNVVTRPDNNVRGGGFATNVRTLAFIEYTQPDMPEIAIARFDGTLYKGAVIKVERKTVKDRSNGNSNNNARNNNARMLQATRYTDENNTTASPSRAIPGSASRGADQSVYRQVTATYPQQATTYAPQQQAPPSAHASTQQTPHRARGFSHLQGTPQARLPMAPVDMTSPACGAMPPPPGPAMYAAPNAMFSGYNMSPYNTMAGGNYTFGSPATGTPMAPNGAAPNPNPSPWTYYTGYWPSMGTAYDPAPMYNPYMFPPNPAVLQSPTPMVGGAGANDPAAYVDVGFVRTTGAAAAAVSTDVGQVGNAETPTRNIAVVVESPSLDEAR